ncbi:MAG: hypothetical protein IE938_09440 [Pseudomonas balearica]|nr:hypothetical protein [Stutzerimonas balearica]
MKKMQYRELSLSGKLDTALVRALCTLANSIKGVVLWLLGLLMLPASVWLAFEYDEGLSDLSWHEWGFLLLLPALLWRHFCYCRHFAFGFWRGLSRLFIFQGALNTVLLFFIGLLLSVVLESDDLMHVLRYLRQEESLGELSALGLTLLAVYLAPPTRDKAASSKPSPASLDATRTAMAKDANP